MAECVDKVQKDYGIESKTKYNPGRNVVVAQGITLFHPTYPPLDASVIFDQNLWTVDTNNSIVNRVYMVPHEIAHVLQRAKEINPTIGVCDGRGETEAEEMKRFAKIIREEFGADKTAVSICNGILRNNQGENVYPGEVMGPWFLDGVRELIGKLSDFARKDVQIYRLTGIGLNGLYANVGPLIAELLLVLVHAIPLYAQMDSMDLLGSSLQDIPGFAACFGEDYDALRDALVMEDNIAAEAEIIRIFNAILYRAGLRIEDLPKSLYVHVHEPLIR
jgi:hypothetical protein